MATQGIDRTFHPMATPSTPTISPRGMAGCYAAALERVLTMAGLNSTNVIDLSRQVSVELFSDVVRTSLAKRRKDVEDDDELDDDGDEDEEDDDLDDDEDDDEFDDDEDDFEDEFGDDDLADDDDDIFYDDDDDE